VRDEKNRIGAGRIADVAAKLHKDRRIAAFIRGGF